MALTDFLAQPNRTSEITKDITIYANGADFGYGELAVNDKADNDETGNNASFTVKIYDAKNIRVWGSAPNAGVKQTFILENCTYEGAGINKTPADGIFYITGNTGSVDLTMNNCKVSGSNQGVYLNCDGNITVTNSVFEECATGMKISHKGSGNCNVTVKDTTFNKCGCTEEMAGNTSWLKDDSAAIKCKTTGSMTLTLKNNTITGTLGDKGDMQIADGVTVVNE